MTDTFFGVPIHGDITAGASRVEQKPLEELAPLFEAVMSEPTIIEFGWTQYTPYYNDGESCEFGVGGLWVKTTAEKELEEAGTAVFDHWDLDVDYHPSLGRIKCHWDPVTRRYINERYEGPDRARYEICQALDRALQSGAFETVLLEKFGDHAKVTVRRDGIEVEYYDHD